MSYFYKSNPAAENLIRKYFQVLSEKMKHYAGEAFHNAAGMIVQRRRHVDRSRKRI